MKIKKSVKFWQIEKNDYNWEWSMLYSLRILSYDENI